MKKVTGRVLASLLFMWFILMSLLTVVCAQQEGGRLRNWMMNESQQNSLYYGRFFSEEEDTAPLEQRMRETVWYFSTVNFIAFPDYGMRGLLRPTAPEIKRGAIFLRGGKEAATSGSFSCFNYLTQQEWDECGDEKPAGNFGWYSFDGKDDPLEPLYNGGGSLWAADAWLLKLTGGMEGDKMTLHAAAVIRYSDFRTAQMNTEPVSSYTDSDGALVEERENNAKELLERGLLQWTEIFDDGQGGESVYAVNLRRCFYEPQKLLFTDADSSANVAEYMDALSLLRSYRGIENGDCLTEGGLWRLTVLRKQTVYRNNEQVGSFLTVSSASPLREALSATAGLWFGTLALVCVIALILIKKIKKKLLEPVKLVSEGLGDNFSARYEPTAPDGLWDGGLYTGYLAAGDRVADLEAENRQLKTALDYAKEAEENRRTLTSHIAHELKTPLAVISSYSEGLKAHIADDKRDQYADVILSQCGKMDGVVQDMLKLSRLEAGRVSLQMGEVSLADIAEDVLEDMALLLEEKALTVQRDIRSVSLKGDTERLTGAIENLLSNAVKYSPPGGHIRVRLRREAGKASFLVANQCEQFSGEELQNVWDSFYRRSGDSMKAGTGLGLAITKKIILLHGGECVAHNTQDGVEFGFRI